MNQAQFNSWYADFCTAYPQTDEFVQRGGNGRATLAHWFDVLSACELDDAMNVTRRMLRGDDDELKPYDRHATPRHVAALCEALRQRRMQPAASRKFEPDFLRNEPEPDWSCGDVLKRLRECAASGSSLMALAERLMPIDPDKEPRFRCLDCRDRGLVTCWHPATMHAARIGKLTGRSSGRYTCVVVCDCKAGKQFESLARGGWNEKLKRFNREEPTLFDPARWIKCEDVNEDSVRELIETMATWSGWGPPANAQQTLALSDV